MVDNETKMKSRGAGKGKTHPPGWWRAYCKSEGCSELEAMVLGVIFVVAFAYISWQFMRKINYRMSYKSMVQATVREMVKSEALRIP